MLLLNSKCSILRRKGLDDIAEYKYPYVASPRVRNAIPGSALSGGEKPATGKFS